MRPRPSGFDLAGRWYGGGGPVYLVAEIGSNHGGSLAKARELVTACAAAGADAVKFQSWRTEGLQNPFELGADGRLVESRAWPILKQYELPDEWHHTLADDCRVLGLDFLSTPFDPDRARLLRSLGCPAVKIASGDLTYTELLVEVGSYGLPVLLSTGMSTLAEVEAALNWLDPEGTGQIVLLHCVAAYPPDPAEANLRALTTLAQVFGRPVGLSDHYPGHSLALAAVALGACVIEKHVIDSRQAGTPDAPHSLEVSEFQHLVEEVRQLEAALGDGIKRPMPSETGGRVEGRRCIYAAKDLPAGRVLEREDLWVVRPNAGGAIPPKGLTEIIGWRTKRFVPRGMLIHWDMLWKS